MNNKELIRTTLIITFLTIVGFVFFWIGIILESPLFNLENEFEIILEIAVYSGSMMVLISVILIFIAANKVGNTKNILLKNRPVVSKILMVLVMILVSFSYTLVLVGIVAFRMPKIFHDTEYAKDYSESAFNKIELGIKTDSVTKLLGNPLMIRDWCCENEDTLLFYSRDKSGGSYYQRIIGIKNGMVVEIIKEFYYD